MGLRRKVSIGVIGAGYLGEFHIQKFLQISGADLKGFYDPDPLRQGYISSKYQLRSFGSLEEILGSVEACVVSAPTRYHHEIAKEAMERERHVLLEKPMCQKASEAEELVELAFQKGLVLQVGHVERFNPAVAELMERARPPFYFEARRETPPVERAMDTDVIMDLMVHDLDILLSFSHSRPEKVDAVGLKKFGEHLDHASCWLSFEDGSRAFLCASRISPVPIRELRVINGESCLKADCRSKVLEIYRFSYAPKGVEGEPRSYDTDPLMEQDRHFLECILEGKRPIVSGQDGLRALRLAEEIRAVIEGAHFQTKGCQQ
jgi:predicted dehydrogenase